MEPSSYYLLWEKALVARDAACVQLAGMALSVVIAWLMTDLLAGKLQRWVRWFYRIGGVVLFFVTIIMAYMGKQ